MKKQNTAFTLIELLVVVGIFTLIIGASFTLLSSGRFSANITEAQIQAEERARTAMTRLSKELHLSAGNRVFIYNEMGTGGSSVLSGRAIYFQIPVGSYDDALDLNDDYSLKWGSEYTEGKYIVYYLDTNSQQLRRAVVDNAGDTVGSDFSIISSGISGITFTQDSIGSDLIDIAITAEGKTGLQTVLQTLSSRVKLRN